MSPDASGDTCDLRSTPVSVSPTPPPITSYLPDPFFILSLDILIFLWITVFFDGILSWPLLFLLIFQVLVGKSVLIDAKAIGAGENKKDPWGPLHWTPRVWAWLVILLSIFGLLFYIINRRQIWINANCVDTRSLKASSKEIKIYDDNHARIAQSANYLIVLNGIILAAYTAIFTKIPPAPASIHNLTVVIKTSGDIYNISGNPSIHYDMPSPNSLQLLIHLLVILSLLVSMLSCIFAINCGLWDRVKKGAVTKKEISERETKALTFYGLAGTSFLYGVIGVYAFSFFSFFDTLSILIVYILSIIPIYSFMRYYEVFNRFISKS